MINKTTAIKCDWACDHKVNLPEDNMDFKKSNIWGYRAAFLLSAFCVICLLSALAVSAGNGVIPSESSKNKLNLINNRSDSSSNSSNNYSSRRQLGDQASLPQDEKLFYMYELDEKYWWGWPEPNSDCTKNKYIKSIYANLSGIGPPIAPEDGLFMTWHFSIFSALYNRYKRSKRRTLDPEKASIFIIPYDLALDGYTDRFTCQNRNPLRCTPGHVWDLQQMLKFNKYFHRHKGADHVVLWSLHQYHAYPRTCDGFMMRFCEHCTITCYWMDFTIKDNRFVSIPFPSGYHYWDGIKNLPWDTKLAPQRDHLAVYVGSTLTITPYHTKIRKTMTGQCDKKKNCHWLRIFHSSTDTRFVEFITIYKKAVFCLCPPGDDPGRKAVFDSIVSGCIPVVFHESTIYNQYPWHMSEETALDISVFIPGAQLIAGTLDMMSILSSISPEVIKKKQEAIALLAPKLQYAIPPVTTLENRSDVTPWDPPFKDAAEMALDGMFLRVQNVLKNESTNIPRVFLNATEWEQRYNTVKIQVPK
jgi:hypothetical protein